MFTSTLNASHIHFRIKIEKQLARRKKLLIQQSYMSRLFFTVERKGVKDPAPTCAF
jgi:hypothetical protein